MHTKTLIVLIGVMIGIICQEVSVYSSLVASVAAVMALLQIFLIVSEKIFEKKKQEKREDQSSRFSFASLSCFLFLGITFGVIRTQFVEEMNLFLCEDSCLFSAVIIYSPEIKEEYQVLVVRPSGSSTVYDISVRVPLYPRYVKGEGVELFGKVLAPKNRTLPNKEGRVFDYVSYLRLRLVGSEMFYPSITSSGKRSLTVASYLSSLRENFTQTLDRHVSAPASTLLSGMLFGNASMSKELQETFRVAGLSHIVVLSGFNIAILIGAVLVMFRLLPLFFRVACAFLFVIFFVLMVGGEVSIIRATLMSCIGLFALLIGRPYVARQALLLSLLCIIIYKPHHLLFDVSLHLSFLATAGIIYFNDSLLKLWGGSSFRYYQEIITTTISAYLITLPYIVYTFGTVSVYALFANMIVLPFVPLTMLLAFLVTISSSSETLTSIFGFLGSVLGDGIIFIARLAEGLPFSSLSVSISFFGMIILYGVFFSIYKIIFSFLTKKKNETLLTKNNEILSEIIAY